MVLLARPNLTVTPPDLIGEPHVPTMDERALHVTIWVAAVFYEAETLDIEMPRPLTIPAMKAALRGACNVIPDSLDEFHPTVPQLGDYYGSFVAQPVWLRNTNKTTLVMDARAIGGVAFPLYQEGRVSLANVGPTAPGVPRDGGRLLHLWEIGPVSTWTKFCGHSGRSDQSGATRKTVLLVGLTGAPTTTPL